MISTTKPPMWAHQRGAVEYVCGQPGSLLDAFMGTGKTRVVIEAWNRKRPKVTVIFCPVAVVPHWRKEWRKYGDDVPRISDAVVAGVHRRLVVAEKEYRVACQYGEPFVFVCTHAMLLNKGVVGFLNRIGVGLLVFDEIHRLKSPTGGQSKSAAALAARCPWRIGLTGTPMPHSPLDLFGQLRCIDLGAFGSSWWAFRNRYAVTRPMSSGGRAIQGGVYVTNPDGTLRIQNLPELESLAAPYMHKVTADVLDLPDVQHLIVDVVLCPAAMKAYRTLDKELVAEVDGGAITPANVLTKGLRLAQLTSGVAVVDEDTPDKREVIIDTGKRDALASLIDAAGSEPFVVFGRFKADIAVAREACASIGVTCMELSGSVKQLEEWQAGKAQVLAVQIQAGGVGVELVRSNYCAYLSTGYNLGDYEQSVARVHRPGQTRPVTYYHLLAKNTIDVGTYDGLAARKSGVDIVLASIGEQALELRQQEQV